MTIRLSEAEIKAKIDEALRKSGEIERLKNLLRARLNECGWKDQIRLECRKVINYHGLSSIDLDSLVKEVTPKAREQIPAAVKKELLEQIQTSVHKQIEISRKLEHPGF